MAVTATGEQNALCLWPVVAARVGVDSRSMSEFAGDHDERIVQHAAVGEVLNEDTHTSVVTRELVL